MGRKKAKPSLECAPKSEPMLSEDDVFQESHSETYSVAGSDTGKSYNSYCEHVASLASVTRDWIANASKRTSCTLCDKAVRSRWLCLDNGCSDQNKDVITVLCGLKDDDHLHTHHKESGHKVFVNLSNSRLFCCECDCEVDKEANCPALSNSLQRALQPMKRGRRQSSRKDIDSSPDSKAIKSSFSEEQLPIAAVQIQKPVRTQGRILDRSSLQNRPLLKNMEDSFEDFPKGLTGLVNVGNTCYFNAAVQALSSCPPFSDFFRDKGDLRPYSLREPMVSNQMTQLIQRLWSPQRERAISPSALLSKVRDNFHQFRGWSQQDAQELIRCLLELINRELAQPVYAHEDYSLPVFKSSRRHSSSSSGDSDQFETADSGWSSDGDTPSTSNSSRGRSRSRSERASNSGVSKSNNDKKQAGRSREPTSWRSIVTEVFDGSIESSVKCLTCQSVSNTTETFQDLSLPIPSQEHLDRISQSFGEEDGSAFKTMTKRNASSGGGWSSWWSWLTSFSSLFLSSYVSLDDCLTAFFSPDRLVGDDMYSCGSCKKLRNGVKQCRIKRAPEVLSIHIKRFRHDSYSSSKVSTRVEFPLVGLDISPYSTAGAGYLYDLCAVVTHEGGGADSGHYLAYCRNEMDGSWYEFDDENVTKLDAAYVMTKEAYVLFYQKRSTSEMEGVRKEVASYLSPEFTVKVSSHSYISTEWLLRLNTFADPGPVSNYSFLCEHGHLLPRRADHISTLCTSVPSSLADMLYRRFGGGPRVTELHYCLVCDERWRSMLEKRMRERNRLREIEDAIRNMQYDGDYAILYAHYLPPVALNKAWMQRFDRFISDPCAEPPGPIDNSSLLLKNKNEQIVFNPKSYHIRMHREVYQLLHSFYGGGPEVFAMEDEQPLDEEERNEFLRDADRAVIAARHAKEERLRRLNEETAGDDGDRNSHI